MVAVLGASVDEVGESLLLHAAARAAKAQMLNACRVMIDLLRAR
jgi:hypothetical protein